jgi:beta-N-acetylhexosaminidase
VVVPAYDFDVTQLGASLDQGAGGVIYLGSAAAPADLGARVAQAERGLAIRPLVMADEEGGGVSRLSPVTSPVPWPRTMAATMTPAQVTALASTIARQMRAAGVDMDLAPVADLDDGVGPSASNPDGSRSFSNTPSVASTYASAFADGLRSAGVVPVVKHFPGLGHSTGNTDMASAQTLPLTQLQAGALPTFASTFPHVGAVMVANATVPGLTTLPASISPAAVNGLLRQQMGWHGLVVTDSLSAGAISQAGLSVPAAAARAVEAGDDLVLWGSTLDPAHIAQLSPPAVAQETTAIIGAIASAVTSGALSRARLEDAVTHVLEAKHLAVC